jgi:hypothetical protein
MKLTQLNLFKFSLFYLYLYFVFHIFFKISLDLKK